MIENLEKPLEPFRIDPNLTIGAVTLGVRELHKTAQFYQEIIGLSILNRTEASVELGIGETRLVILEARPDGRRYPRSTGLYHIAILLPTRKDLGHWLKHLIATHYPLSGAGDHLVSEALYLSDPEGNGIEMYHDRPRELWEYNENGVKMATLAVDLESLQAEAPPDEFSGLPAETIMGHVHLKVDEVNKAMSFYRDLLGFDLTASWQGAAFLSAGGYHHHIGANIWNSRGADPPPTGSLGLASYRIELSAEEARNQLLSRLNSLSYPIKKVESEPFIRDPAGNGIILAIKK